VTLSCIGNACDISDHVHGVMITLRVNKITSSSHVSITSKQIMCAARDFHPPPNREGTNRESMSPDWAIHSFKNSAGKPRSIKTLNVLAITDAVIIREQYHSTTAQPISAHHHHLPTMARRPFRTRYYISFSSAIILSAHHLNCIALLAKGTFHPALRMIKLDSVQWSPRRLPPLV